MDDESNRADQEVRRQIRRERKFVEFVLTLILAICFFAFIFFISFGDGSVDNVPWAAPAAIASLVVSVITMFILEDYRRNTPIDMD